MFIIKIKKSHSCCYETEIPRYHSYSPISAHSYGQITRLALTQPYECTY